MKLRSKTVAVTTAVLVVAGGGAALAYWTTTGTGTGSAATASANGSLTLHADFAAGLTPGASVPVTFTADNPGTSSLRLSEITDVTVSTGTPGCLAGDFVVRGLTTTPATVAAGSRGTKVGTATLAFTDTGVDQDACKGATVTLSVSSR